MPNWKVVADGEDIDINEYVDFRQYDTIAERDAASADFGSQELFHLCRVVETGYYYYWQGASWARFPAQGGAGAPVDASYITLNSEPALSAEALHKNLTGANVHPPKVHATQHQSGGGDEIKLDDLEPPDDNTDLNASTSKHGLLPKLGGGTVNYFRADGTWNAPPGGAAHDLGGAQHNADTLANLNAKVSDATLDTSTGTCTRLPPSHGFAGTTHSASSLAAVNTKITDATLSESPLTTHGDIEFRDAAGRQRLAAGASGKYLKTQGAGADPVWDTPAAGGDMLKSDYDQDNDLVVDNSEKLENSTKAEVQNHTPIAHKSRHVSGGGDSFAGGDLLNATARVAVDKNGVLVGTRRNINFIEGAGTTLTVTDDAGNEEVDVRIAVSGGAAHGAYKYLVYYSAPDYYAEDWEGNIVYGGPDDNGGKDGEDAAAVINACLADGGTTLLRSGTYTVTSSIILNGDNTSLIGESWLNTTIQGDFNNDDIIVIGQSGAQRYRVSVQDLRLTVASGRSGVTGIVQYRVLYSYFHNIEIMGSETADRLQCGWRFKQESDGQQIQDSWFDTIYIKYFYGVGWYWEDIEDSIFSNILIGTVRANATACIHWQSQYVDKDAGGSGVMCSNIHLWGSSSTTDYGIFMSGAYWGEFGSSWVNVKLDGFQTYGIYLEDNSVYRHQFVNVVGYSGMTKANMIGGGGTEHDNVFANVMCFTAAGGSQAWDYEEVTNHANPQGYAWEGRHVVQYASSGGTYRIYHYVNSGWHYGTLT